MYLTKSSYAAARLREALASGQYAPGERLQANRVAKELDLSLTPVREAMLSLASEGLIVMVPHRGATVADFSEERLAEVFDVRAYLECHATAKAATLLTRERLDHVRDVQQRLRAAVEEGKTEHLRELNDDFHFSIYEASGSDLFERLIRQVWAASPRDIFSVLPGRGLETVADHDRILAALESGDAELAAKAMRAHLDNSLRLQKRALATEPGC